MRATGLTKVHTHTHYREVLHTENNEVTPILTPSTIEIIFIVSILVRRFKSSQLGYRKTDFSFILELRGKLW